LLLPVTPWSRDCGIKADQPSTIRNRLFSHFLNLTPEHIHLASCSAGRAWNSIGLNKVATERDVEPVALLTLQWIYRLSAVRGSGAYFHVQWRLYVTTYSGSGRTPAEKPSGARSVVSAP
jgi:hypothetical protein